MCRYCFEGLEAGPLISPCLCKGDQKYVHLACLRRWQRVVLVSQPTHPAFYDKDPRHYVCNVCKGTFTCEPPTRLELMASFTGPELGALMEAGCVIASHAEFTAELTRQMADMPPFLQERSSYAHWCGGVYLITEVAPLDATLEAPISSANALSVIRERLGDNLTISLSGQTLRLVPGGSLADATEESLPAALAALEYEEGIRFVLQRHPPPGCGDDHVTAINLTRVIEPHDPAEVATQTRKALAKYPQASEVEIVHYIGGPCSPEEVSTCVVTGGSGVGWTIVPKLSDAIELAHMRSYVRSEAQGVIFGGASVRLCGLQGRPELNGECGIALRFVEESGRWLVRLKDGEGKSLKPSNLEPIGAGHGVVHCVWGDAQWSRTQLLGEIARGHWGLCRASVAELIAEPTGRWDTLDGRLVFAPDTEMMEDFIRHGGSSQVAQMEREAALNARAGGLTTRRSDDNEDEEAEAATVEAAVEAAVVVVEEEEEEEAEAEGATVAVEEVEAAAPEAAGVTQWQSEEAASVE